MDNMEFLYEITSLTTAIFIVLFSFITLYLGIKYFIMTKFKKTFDRLVFLQVGIALVWVIIFGYIVEESIRVEPPTIIGSFGNIFIRPAILLSSVSVSIWMAIRYKFEKSGGQDKWNLQKS